MPDMATWATIPPTPTTGGWDDPLTWKSKRNLDSVIDEMFGPPKMERRMMPLTKQQFWDTVICFPNNIRRFVAKTDLETVEKMVAKERKHDPETDTYTSVPTLQIEHKMFTEMWAPDNMNEDFNLVLSLCTDGTHRPVLDLDFTSDQLKFIGDGLKIHITEKGNLTQIKLPRGRADQIHTVAVESTNFLHVYSNVPMSFEEYLELLGQFPGPNVAAYKHNVAAQGYGALRPPWIKKLDPPKVSTFFAKSVFEGVPDMKKEIEELTKYKSLVLPRKQGRV